MHAPVSGLPASAPDVPVLLPRHETSGLRRIVQWRFLRPIIDALGLVGALVLALRWPHEPVPLSEGWPLLHLPAAGHAPAAHPRHVRAAPAADGPRRRRADRRLGVDRGDVRRRPAGLRRRHRHHLPVGRLAPLGRARCSVVGGARIGAARRPARGPRPRPRRPPDADRRRRQRRHAPRAPAGGQPRVRPHARRLPRRQPAATATRSRASRSSARPTSSTGSPSSPAPSTSSSPSPPSPTSGSSTSCAAARRWASRSRWCRGCSSRSTTARPTSRSAARR